MAKRRYEKHQMPQGSDGRNVLPSPRGHYRNFASNAYGEIVPISFCVEYEWTTDRLRPKHGTNPLVVLKLTQTDSGKRYPVTMTPDEARRLAARLVEQAAAVEDECRPPPEGDF